jgi:hypothetical protein
VSRFTSLVCCLASLLAMAAAPAIAEDSASPHEMVLPDGKPDMNQCGLCHEEDMTLSRSKVETCTLCHSETVHSGAREHLAASAAAVAHLVPKPDAAALPLTDDGRIYCGTCHVFHDPRVSKEAVLDQPWVPSDSLSQAVRQSLAAQLRAAAPAEGEGASPMFSDGTKRLRLPIADGTLCRHCHRFAK